MRRSILLPLLCLVSTVAAGNNWALLFTGANGLDDYSTHSNLCHAYHVLHDAGLPDERIVVIMYDDVADDPDNPFPGQLFNNYSRTDVYKGTPLDYTGEEITAELVLAVLRGDRATVKNLTGRDGKVVDSGPEDTVFVAYSGHGLPGMLMMPHNKSLTARNLVKTIETMHEQKRFAKLVFYVESCMSGSMFQDLRKDIDVFALTASDATHVADQNYCWDPAFFDEGVCLGGEFSTGWTESAERSDLATTTVGDHVRDIIKAVNDSHPQQYGNFSIKQTPLGKLFGARSSSSFHQASVSPPARPSSPRDKAPFNMAPYTLLKRKAEMRPLDRDLQIQLARMRAMFSEIDRFFHSTALHVYPDAAAETIARITRSPAGRISNWDCYEAAVETATSSCASLLRAPKVKGYALSKFSTLVNLCNRSTGAKVTQAIRAAADATVMCRSG